MKYVMAALVVVALAVPAGANPGPDTVRGTAGPDDLRGGNSPDVIYGLGGDDIIHGNKGPDKEYGGPGDDHISSFGSGEVSDLVDGGSGWDVCRVTRNDIVRACEVVKVRKGLGPRR